MLTSFIEYSDDQIIVNLGGSPNSPAVMKVSAQPIQHLKLQTEYKNAVAALVSRA